MEPIAMNSSPPTLYDCICRQVAELNRYTIFNSRMTKQTDAPAGSNFYGLGLYAYSEMLSTEKICTGIAVELSRHR